MKSFDGRHRKDIVRFISICTTGVLVASLAACTQSGTSDTGPTGALTCNAQCLTSSPTLTSPVTPDGPSASSSVAGSSGPASSAPASKPTSSASNAPTHPLTPSARTTPIAQAIYIWYVTGTVQQDIDAINSDTKAIASATGSNDKPKLTAACGALKRDVARFQSDPPAPDSTARVDFSRAMNFYAAGAMHCLAGDYPVAANDFVTGTQWAYQAKNRIAKLTGT